MFAAQFEEILDRYLKGQANADEVRLVDYWYQSFDEGGDYASGNSGLGPADLQRGMASGLDAIRAALGQVENLNHLNLDGHRQEGDGHGQRFRVDHLPLFTAAPKIPD